eukprot:SAG31_NODE_6558_length_1976_cov_4.575422_4_plen_112_part_01
MPTERIKICDYSKMRISTQHVYNPIGIIRSHKVFFDNADGEHYQKQLVDQTVQFLSTLSNEQLKLQSVQFFKWLVIGDQSNLELYADKLLSYFKSRGLLLHKSISRPQQRQS